MLVVFSGPSGPAQALGCTGQQTRLSPSQGLHISLMSKWAYLSLSTRLGKDITPKMLLLCWLDGSWTLECSKAFSKLFHISYLKYSPISHCFGETFFVLEAFPTAMLDVHTLRQTPAITEQSFQYWWDLRPCQRPGNTTILPITNLLQIPVFPAINLLCVQSSVKHCCC